MPDPASEPKYETARRYAFLALSAATAVCGLLRACGVVDKERVSVDILYFFAVAGVLLVLERVRKLSIGPTGVVTEMDPAILQAAVREAVQPGVQEVKEAVAENQRKIDAVSPAVGEVKRAVEQNQMMIEGGVMGRVRREVLSPTTGEAAVPPTARKRRGRTARAVDGIWQLEPPTVVDDPQKGRFGGLSDRDGRRLRASHDESKDTEQNYAVVLEVVSTDPTKPLVTPVTFYLHDTFAQDVRPVRVRDGVARLTVWAYGAFTVGAVADDGRTPLELDLADCEHLPQGFRDA